MEEETSLTHPWRKQLQMSRLAHHGPGYNPGVQRPRTSNVLTRKRTPAVKKPPTIVRVGDPRIPDYTVRRENSLRKMPDYYVPMSPITVDGGNKKTLETEVKDSNVRYAIFKTEAPRFCKPYEAHDLGPGTYNPGAKSGEKSAPPSKWMFDSKVPKNVVKQYTSPDSNWDGTKDEQEWLRRGFYTSRTERYPDGLPLFIHRGCAPPKSYDTDSEKTIAKTVEDTARKYAIVKGRAPRFATPVAMVHHSISQPMLKFNYERHVGPGTYTPDLIQPTKDADKPSIAFSSQQPRFMRWDSEQVEMWSDPKPPREQKTFSFQKQSRFPKTKEEWQPMDRDMVLKKDLGPDKASSTGWSFKSKAPRFTPHEAFRTDSAKIIMMKPQSTANLAPGDCERDVYGTELQMRGEEHHVRRPGTSSFLTHKRPDPETYVKKPWTADPAINEANPHLVADEKQWHKAAPPMASNARWSSNIFPGVKGTFTDAPGPGTYQADVAFKNLFG